MNAPTDRLYPLLPALYRARDADHGKVLEKLCEILELPLAAVEEDLARLYDAWFIETCDEEVVPYIGDLLGVKPLQAEAVGFSARARIGHTIGHRRRKGTAAMLEQLARDVTGWPAKVVEYFQAVATTQYLNHLRPDAAAWLAIRDVATSQLADSPFGTAPHTADVRSIALRRGRYNLPSIGIHLWRIDSRRIERGTARAVSDVPRSITGRCFTIDPLGITAPLYLRPTDEPSVDHRADIWNVPTPIDRRKHHADPKAWYGERKSVEIFVDGTAVPIEALVVADLTVWHRALPEMSSTTPPERLLAALDPVLGRVRIIGPAAVREVQATYHFGGIPGIGAGPEDRHKQWAAQETSDPVWQRVVTQATGDGQSFRTLDAAIAAWLAQDVEVGLIAISDDATYVAPRPIVLPAGRELTISAGQGSPFTPGLCRPHVVGDLVIRGEGALGFVIDGILLEGSLRVESTSLPKVRVSDCTIANASRPMPVTLSAGTASPGEPTAAVHIVRSILGALTFQGTSGSLRVEDCIIDARDQAEAAGSYTTHPAIYAGVQVDELLPAPPTTVTGTTLFGSVEVTRLELGSNCIFSGGVRVRSRQEGCVRFSYVGPGSLAPRRFRCQPDVDHLDAADAAAKDARVRPHWLSLEWGTAGYARLMLHTPDEIRRGAEDESEMGAWHFRKEPQREANLRASLDEYLRFGLVAGILFDDENQNGVRESPEWPGRGSSA